MWQASQEVCDRGTTTRLFLEHRLSSMLLEQLGLKDGGRSGGPAGKKATLMAVLGSERSQGVWGSAKGGGSLDT